jgi:hypothetical protein
MLLTVQGVPGHDVSLTGGAGFNWTLLTGRTLKNDTSYAWDQPDRISCREFKGPLNLDGPTRLHYQRPERLRWHKYWVRIRIRLQLPTAKEFNQNFHPRLPKKSGGRTRTVVDTAKRADVPGPFPQPLDANQDIVIKTLLFRAGRM